MTRFGIVSCVIATGLLLTASTRPAFAGPFEVRELGWEGCSGLLELARAELGEKRVVPISHLDWSDLGPDDAILLMHPDHAISGDKLTAFLDAGGRVAVLDDFGAGDKILGLFRIKGSRIERVAAPTRPLAALRKNPDLAVAEPVREAIPGQDATVVHPTVQNVERLMTNHPTGLRNPKLTSVLKIRAVDEPDVVLALAGNYGDPPRGKLFAMGDPSALINQMLRYPGNRAFAIGLIHYLTENTGGEPLGGRLFVMTNRFSESGSYARAGSLKSELDSRLESASQEIARLTHDGLSGTVGLALAALVAFGIGVWTTTVSSRIYRRRQPTFARPVPLVAQGGIAGRAAVLAAETTPRALAMLELKSALEEGIAHQLGLAPPVATSALLDEVKRKKALDDRRYRALQGALLDMAGLETALLARQPTKAKTADVLRMSRLVSDVLASVRERTDRRERAA